ncbi:DUF5687 family protein [Croceibacter atlanticus]|jgi:hypothetical protein|uniref:Uncharacterized protein n=1 Tax=Croceibacter atlanticus (strain ATCC BAA-628 / JCM 21780 / CIP 108009 / IAM 15332 / KCTC 12090 / HTCC2559) TaxID=216432 RepID=A3U624_CROAH|nr:DUF5687 family protein [Croceibacter atlanticus]EAP87691.1 hypothetical protein CA2559_03010 [Croceibacter atlanticus HTCC2559]
MIKRFISLEWKQFKRSSYFQKGLAIKILLIFGALYFMTAAFFLGISAFFMAEEFVKDVDPFVTINNYVIYWFLFDLVFRFFMHQLPVMNIKPYMIIPIKRETVIHYLLGKTTISFFNLLPLFLFVPITGVLLFKGYAALSALTWLISMLGITLCNNFLNFLINKNNVFFYSLLSVLAIFIGLEFYDIYKVSKPLGVAFYSLYTQPYLVIIPLIAAFGLYKANYSLVRSGFYLDGAISKKTKAVTTENLSWLDRFGSIAVFLKNDIKLIKRNARPKQVLMMSFIFLFYGLIFYTQETYREMPVFLAFASIFVTGGFLLSFGQLVPSWDSEYYKLLMSQNIPYRKYLESKWYLMVVAVAISFILSTPYIYFGWDIYGMIAAGALFNIGLNSFITLFGGALNRVPVELNVKAKAFSNTQGFNPTQLLIALPKMIGPMLIFYVPYKLIDFNAGIIALAISGILGIALKGVFLNKIEAVYQKGKYKTIAAFNEKK